MRRLNIVLIGRSTALAEIGRELEQHGHRLDHLCAPGSLDEAAADLQLVIEDGSLPLPDLPACEHLGLRVATSLAKRGLPALELLGWHGSATAQRLIICQALATEPSGNGQALRLRAIQAWVERIAVEVSRFSRNPAHFTQATVAGPARQATESGLQRLDALAFEHLLNHTTDEVLERQAQTTLIEALDESLVCFAERTALSMNGQSLSYAQLQGQALKIQASLIEQFPCGVSGQVVGVCLEKSFTLYAAILAVLGCGAVYLPLDPSHPSERVRHILADAKACAVLHDGTAQLAGLGIPTLDLRQLDTPQPAADARLMRQPPSVDAPCVAIYTSGTTGQPKGVLLSQHNLSHFQAWYCQHVQLNEQRRVLQFSTIGFDASLLDIFPTLIAGAELVVPSEDQRRDPRQLLELIKVRGVTHAFLPPALLSILPADEPLGLEHLITGGDVCEPTVIERLARGSHLHNIYGPTETTVLATTRVLNPGDNNRDIGRPIANTQVLILDEALQPVAHNTMGELYIAGAGVGLGYLNNPLLTAERFVALDLPDGTALRAYRTGDMGRWTDDGIAFCGRRDHQVKIRGFRVEPEEIEHTLRASGLFAQVAVVIDPHKRILAFAAGPHIEASLAALRQYAERQLPGYMQPAVLRELTAMPFTPNGKVDRRALSNLPLPEREQAPRCLPANACEQRLLTLWATLLELPEDDIGTDESFFNLGGHSILLSRLLLQVREQFQCSIPINRFIETPTLQRLASLIGGAQEEANPVCPQALIDACRTLELTVLPVSQLGDVHRIILTGANSFLGVHLVEALLAWGATEVACLVRATPTQTASERFAQAMRENRLDHLDLSRVSVITADISQPGLGLSDTEYERLDRDFGVLIHNAAHVNHVLDYPALAADNVEPIFECLRLCEGQRKKIFNFVSTLSASSATGANGSVLEQPPAQTPPIYIRNGYNLSKWVAERILQRAREQGVWVNLYRPGNITFHSDSGVCQPHKNRLMLMLKGSLQLGQVPALKLNFDLMPVDFLARFIAFHSSCYQPRQAVFNLHNPEPLSWDGYVASFRELGHAFELVSVEAWQRQLQRVDNHNALFGVLGFYLDGFEEDIGDISRIDHDNALAGVLRMGERYPSKSPALLRKGCQYLKDIQFI
ncbi:non-ribosomal peptide synthetase [Pseudomonas sp. R5(2019)]|uniref:non-ribosomal peptide synthetase n=1 Tax=Pseudomonas sp. R5(2019) TaxID=2697566 RepID=UPI001411F069|nr:non-ribosomal peptide synthetase [Pseudomonas sp. R5(2019)]NBA97844.1 amino acid adenylation domain-containing protein [Pseudomonas sp. R5(2019)]